MVRISPRTKPTGVSTIALLLTVAALSDVGTAVGQSTETSEVLAVVSPQSGSTVESGALFVVIEVDSRLAISRESLVLLIDDRPTNAEPKVSPSSIRYLVREPLTSGTHTASFSARTIDGRSLPALAWSFNVAGSARSAARSASGPTIRGSTFVGSRNADFSGDRDLRQEPLATYIAQTDLTGQYGKFTFPVRMYLTSDESSRSQPRNRVLVGVESPWFAIYGGDTQPAFGPLTLSGIRSRGGLAELTLPGVRLSFAKGRLRRAVDVVSRSDESTAVNPFLNTYRRDMTAARIAFGSPRTVEFSMHGMKAVDDTASLGFGRRPMENLVAGSDLAINLLRGRVHFAAGNAISLTTEDRSRGIADKAELDSLFGVDLPIDPADFGWLITLNTTTVPLRLDKLTSLAWYATSRANLGDHRVAVEYRSVGSAFYSAGNPFLLNDRRSVTASDRFSVANRLTGTVRFQWYGSQPDEHELANPLSSTLYATNLGYRMGSSLPTVSAGVRYNTRRRGEGELMTSDSRMLSVTLGGLQQFTTGSVRHTVQVSATHTGRRDRVNESTDSNAMTLGVGLFQRFSDRVSASAQATLVSIEYPHLEGRQRWTSVRGGLSRNFASASARISGDAHVSRAAPSSLLTGSIRYGGGIIGTYDVQRNMTIELELGMDAFRDDAIKDARYTERFVMLRHRYRF